MALVPGYLELSTPSGVKKIAAVQDDVTGNWYQQMGDPNNILNVEGEVYFGQGLWSSFTSFMTTQLDALAAGAHTAISTSKINNSVNGNTYMDLELVLNTMAGAPVRDEEIKIYVLPLGTSSLYPTNAAGTTTGQPSTDEESSSFHLVNATSQRRIIRNILIPKMTFGVVVRNDSTRAFAATGNILSYLLHF